ncbi:4Fe-4S binding protein [Desulfosoma sp.]|uniref:4Fe-4S binding protein n=1 Tax=Desulfosoma sp. TaxID=2603217 RepID=UPI00404AF7D7
MAPKLVECGRHFNIELMTHTELERLEGEAPRFQATLRRRPRYVDASRCVACGECARVCPVRIEDPRCGPHARVPPFS